MVIVVVLGIRLKTLSTRNECCLVMVILAESKVVIEAKGEVAGIIGVVQAQALGPAEVKNQAGLFVDRRWHQGPRLGCSFRIQQRTRCFSPIQMTEDSKSRIISSCLDKRGEKETSKKFNRPHLNKRRSTNFFFHLLIFSFLSEFLRKQLHKMT